MPSLTKIEQITLLLSIIAIIISGCSAFFTYTQTQVMQAENLPAIHFKVNFTYNPEKQYFTHDELDISNLGGSLSELNGQCRVFLIISYANSTELKWKTKMIDIYDYYLIRSRSTYPQGLLFTLSYPINEDGNNWYVTRFIKEFPNVAAGKQLFATVDILRIVRLNYNDIYKNHHDEYYFADQFGGHLVDTTVGKQLLEADPSTYRVLSARDLNSTEVLNYILES
jgi:hypothetical protein